jgi:hypothetical protein
MRASRTFRDLSNTLLRAPQLTPPLPLDLPLPLLPAAPRFPT